MPIWTVIAKAGGTSVTLEDLGITIAANTQVTLSNYFDYSDLADSQDLWEAVDNPTPLLTLNDGNVDLTPEEAVNYIKRDNVHEDLLRNYTKTELNTSGGGGAVHWDNVTNAPSFGSPTWINPVLYRVVQISGSEPVGPEINDVYIDTDDQNYYKWDGVDWNSVGSAAATDRVIDLSSNPELVNTFNGTDTWTPSPEEVDNSAVMVNDDGDGRNAQYVYSTETGEWIKIADVDFDDHLNGGPSKHTAGQVDVEGTYTNLPSAPDDLETVIGDINTQLTEALDNNTLDGAYNEGGSGAGALITADSGPVTIDRSTSTRAGFRIVPKGALPSSSLQDGEFAVSDGLLFIYDAARSMWLSVQRQYLTFGRRKKTKDQYLNLGVGNMPSNNSGYRMIRNGVIVGMSGQLDDNGTCVMQVRRNDQPTVLDDLTISGTIGAIENSSATAFSVDDYLQAYLASSGGVSDPVFIVEIAYTL